MLQRLVVGVALVFFGLAGYSYWAENRDPWALSVAQTETDVGKIELNEETTVAWTLINRSGQDLRLVGIVDEPC